MEEIAGGLVILLNEEIHNSHLILLGLPNQEIKVMKFVLGDCSWKT
jgi:hypothetical protein